MGHTQRRIQLKRTRGWRKPEGTIVVSRPSKWGNPFKVGDRVQGGEVIVTVRDRAHAVELPRDWLIEQPDIILLITPLRGHDLACWCPLERPCHADVLLELANRYSDD